MYLACSTALEVIMHRIAAAVLLVAVAIPLSINAQSTPTRMQAHSDSEFTVGYSYLFRDYRHTQLNPVGGGMNGWAAEYAPQIASSHFGFGVAGAGYYAIGGFFTPQIYLLTIGPRYTLNTGRSTVTLRMLAGTMISSGDVIAQTSSHIRRIFGAGAGWEYPAGQRFAWRADFDWIYGGFNSNDTNQISEIVRNNGRASVGPVWRF